jgi:hypothetical protein
MAAILPMGRSWQALFWLSSNVQLYLTGFLKSINRHKTSNYSQKSARFERAMQAFTMFAFTIIAAYMKYTNFKGGA